MGKEVGMHLTPKNLLQFLLLRYMSSILASIVHASFQQHVPQSWAALSIVHDGAITLINAVIR